MSQLSLSQINVFPVKSAGGISLSSAWVEFQGLTFDRRFMLVTREGVMITARKYPKMQGIKAALVSDGVAFSAPGMSDLVVRYSDCAMQEVKVTVWHDTFAAYSTTPNATEWFSDALGIAVQLVYCGAQSNREREKVGHNVSFADSYPVLIIGQASLDELNQRSSEHHSMAQFRTNLVVSGGEPFAEDTWKRIRIGEVEFVALKPCERCIMTTIDPQTHEYRSNKEPLKTLATFRTNSHGGVDFGQNLVALNEGMIQAGDQIEILELLETPPVYTDSSNNECTLICTQKSQLARDFVLLQFETADKRVLDFLPGQHVALHLQIDGEEFERRYTIASAPGDSASISIAIKRVEGGKVSNWLVDNLAVNDKLTASMPQGDFYLPEQSDAPLLLLSAGSGVTPMLSMLESLAQKQQLNDVVFYHQCRSEADIPCGERLQQLAEQYAGLTVNIVLTQPSSSWMGAKGRLSLSHIKSIANVAGRQVFVCGPDGFMQKAKNLLLKKGLPEENYHQEVFGFTGESAANVKATTLSLTIDGESFSGNNQATLLEQAEDAGLKILSSCRAGFCGCCKVEVKSGQYSQPDAPALTDDDRKANKVLACCCVPQSDMEVNSH